MEPIVSCKISRKIPVAEHLSDEEYIDFLDAYAFFSGSKPVAERLKYCADQIQSVNRANESIIVTYNNGLQFTVETTSTATVHHKPMNVE